MKYKKLRDASNEFIFSPQVFDLFHAASAMTIDLSHLQLASSMLQHCPMVSLEDAQGERAETWSAKREYLLQLPQLRAWARTKHWVLQILDALTPREQVCALSLIAICQEHLLEVDPQKIADGEEKWRAFLDCLAQTESFYSDIGGIIGYHVRILELLTRPETTSEVRFDPPPAFDWSNRSCEIDDVVLHGLQMWSQTALIIPAGGAGDRLDLRDALTHLPLPAAFLELDGVSMLEGILRDVRGVEYLAQKATGRPVETPIAIMTSTEKDNHAQIAQFLEQHRYFGRSPESIRLFCQHSVPVVAEDGQWVSLNPLQLSTKPGGHGVLWRLARNCGIFEWLKGKGCEKAIVRQINNPVAGSDVGLLALSGFGWKLDKPLGFACCEHKAGMAEGVNAVVERRVADAQGYTYAIENIEYSDLPKELEGANASERSFLANVNLLFVDLPTMNALSVSRPLPGLMVNFKAQIASNAESGQSMHAGRLESTLQNIAQYLTHFEESRHESWQPDQLPQFATSGERLKSLSAAKRSPTGTATIETPLTAYLDMQQGLRALIHSCGFDLPVPSSAPPSVVIALHPALGPDHAIIRQKLVAGSLGENSELRLDIANIDCRDLHLHGSLIVESRPKRRRAHAVTEIPTRDLEGSCTLHRLRVENGGIPPLTDSDFWRAPPKRTEALHIVLHGESEFIARDLTICGPHRIEVPSGHSITAKMVEGRLLFEMRPLQGKIRFWNYHWISSQCVLERRGPEEETTRRALRAPEKAPQPQGEELLARSGTVGEIPALRRT